MNAPDVDFDDAGLVVAVVQHQLTGDVLMVAHMNHEALEATVETGQAHFWSRSRDELWHKGATSGNTMDVVSVQADCDGDAVLVAVIPAGPACHTDADTCFGDSESVGFRSLEELGAVIRSRARELPTGSYTTSLLTEGVDKPARKVLEEAGEVAFAAMNHASGAGSAAEVIDESADLVYHLLVLLAERGIAVQDVLAELRNR